MASDTFDFSLVRGGPAYRVLARTGLEGPRPAVRIAVLALAAWAPLCLLAAAQGLAVGDRVRLPFLADWSAHVRFLFSVPLLILCERPIDRRLTEAAEQLLASRIVDGAARERFSGVLAGVIRMRDSALVEALLLAGALAVGLFALAHPRVPGSWYAPAAHGFSPSLAGWWYACVSAPLFVLLMFRWLWRIASWALLLARTSRLPLALSALHPDRAGGLAFLAESQASFAWLVVPLAAAWGTSWRNQILYAGANPKEFERALVVFIAAELIVLVGPLMLFAPALYRARLRSLLAYSSFAGQYAREFTRKWLDAAATESPLGSPDIESLGGLSESFDFARRTRPIPIDRRLAVTLVVAAAVPLLPVLAVLYPLPELARKLVGRLW